MSMSNRFEVETIARQRQAELERNLRHSTRLELSSEPSVRPAQPRVNVGPVAILVGRAAVSTALAYGASVVMAMAFVMAR